MTEHCPGCTCDLMARDVGLVEISGELMHHLVRGEWSAPVRLKANHLGHGRFELTAETVDLRFA